MSRKPAMTPLGKLPSLLAAAVLSFLKETRGILRWTIKDLQKSLLITSAEARQVTAVLELQGYIKRAGGPDDWLTTIHGETVSGSKAPRFNRERVEQALSSLQERIKLVNKDLSSPYMVTTAVAFGDFLAGRAQAQAADVGIQLTRRSSQPRDAESAEDKMSKRAFLKKFRAKNVNLHLVFYEAWMSERSHRALLSSHPQSRPS
jgi:hypothetical protein